MAKEVMLSDGPSGGGHGEFSAPPPPGGLGNFKGVMLCNRPTEISVDKAFTGGDGPPPFKSTVAPTHNDQLGLNPTKVRESGTDPQAKLRGPSAALRKHVKWLKELQKQMAEDKEEFEMQEVKAEVKKQRMKKFCEKQREAVNAVLNSDLDVKKEDIHEALQTAGAGKKGKDGKRVKPLWAMTEQEKEAHQEKEADDLLSFAEDLDFDKYIGDLEFRENLEVLRDRAGKISKEQDAFKDALVSEFNADDEPSPRDDEENRSIDGLDGASLGISEGVDSLGGKRSRRNKTDHQEDGKPEWDSSTACGDEQHVHAEERDMAARILEMNPGVRGIHSEKSVQKILEQQRAKEIVDLVDRLKNEVAAPDPVIVTSSDTMGKQKKKVDPSMLPYLYRSPAI